MSCNSASTFSPRPLLAAVMLGLVLLNASCGGGQREMDVDTLAPVIEVVFPPAAVVSEHDRIIVRGTGADISGIDGLTVGGVDAFSDDGFATWQVELPLSQGINHFAIVATDSLRNQLVVDEAVTVRRVGSLLRTPLSIAIDEFNNRAIVMDGAPNNGGIKAIDLANGTVSVISGWQTRGSGVNIGQGSGLALDSSSNRAFVVDRNSNELVAVDLATGDRETFSQLNSDVGGVFDIREVVLDKVGGRLFIPSHLGHRIFSVSLHTGRASVLSGEQQDQESEANFTRLKSVALDRSGNRLIALDSADDRLVSVDLETGERSIFLEKAELPSGIRSYDFAHLLVDDARRRLLIESNSKNQVYAVDLDTREISTFSEAPNRKLYVGNFHSETPALSAALEAMYSLDSRLDRVVKIDLQTGEQSLVVSNMPTDLYNAFSDVHDFEVGWAGARAWVANATSRELIEIDLESGERTVVMRGRTIRDIAYLAGSQQLYFIDTAADSLNSLDLIGGAEQSVVTSLSAPKNLSLAADGSRAWVLDQGALLEIDLSNGTTKVLASSELLEAGNLLMRFTFDRAHNRLIAIDSNEHLVSIDLETGQRTVLSSNESAGAFEKFNQPQDLVINPSGTLAFVVDSVRQTLVEVDLTTGSRRTFDLRGILAADSFGTVFDNGLEAPFGLRVSDEGSIAVVADQGLDTLVYVDLLTNHKVLLDRL